MDLRPVINVAVFGCVSVGKSTFLNMIMNQQFSDCHRKRTTTMPQIYYELTKHEYDNVNSKTINDAIQAYFSGLKQYDSVFSVTKTQTRFYDKNANPLNHNPQELIRTQDLESLYEENSNFYIFSKESYI